MLKLCGPSRLIAIVLLFVLVSPAAAGAIERLDAFLEGLNSLEARFVQTVETEQGVSGPAVGTFYLQRPGRFRWDYDGEDAQLIVADGKRVWLLDRELEQVSHQAQESALRGTPAQLLAEKGAVEEYFTVADGGESDGQSWIELMPKDEESQFALVRIGLDGETISRLEMADRFGQSTRFAFANVRRNPPLDDGLFEFKPPAGWDVFQVH
jgi:outer membrane lipoprotein carrier protein